MLEFFTFIAWVCAPRGTGRAPARAGRLTPFPAALAHAGLLRFAAAAALLLSPAAAAPLLPDDSVITHAAAPLPAPPCFSAFNPDLETSCSRTVATDRASNVTVRAYEAAGVNITFLTASETVEPTYQEGLEVCIALFIPYFVSFNRQQVPVNRTVPIVSSRLGSPADSTYKWTSGMALPASVYPSAATAPVPDEPDFVQFSTPFAANPLVAVHHFVTPALAADEDWAAAAAFLAAHVPRGYHAVAGATPVFAIYDGRDATTPRNNEVWLAVVKGA